MPVHSLGEVPANTTLYLMWTSHDGQSGANAAQTGLAVTDIEVYKNGSTTQRSSDNGYALLDTDGQDFDSMTGVNGISISLSDNSDAGFYAAGSRYDVFISSVTIDGQTVIIHLAHFRIRAADTIQKNVALAGFQFVMLDSADGVSGKTGLTVTAQVSKDGAAFVACTNSPTEIGGGIYKISLAAADLNADTVILKFTATGALMTVIGPIVTQANA